MNSNLIEWRYCKGCGKLKKGQQFKQYANTLSNGKKVKYIGSVCYRCISLKKNPVAKERTSKFEKIDKAKRRILMKSLTPSLHPYL